MSKCCDFYLGEYHGFYLKSDTLLLADIFELSVSGLAWQAASKETDTQLELLRNIDMLLMVEKVIRGDMSLY